MLVKITIAAMLTDRRYFLTTELLLHFHVLYLKSTRDRLDSKHLRAHVDVDLTLLTLLSPDRFYGEAQLYRLVNASVDNSDSQRIFHSTTSITFAQSAFSRPVVDVTCVERDQSSDLTREYSPTFYRPRNATSGAP